MPNPRVTDAEKKRRGTFRPDRAESTANTEPENEALATYKELSHEILGRALDDIDVTEDIEYLREAESALFQNGIATWEGRQWNMSTIIDLTMQSRQWPR